MTISFLEVAAWPVSCTMLTKTTCHCYHGCEMILTTDHNSPQTALAKGLDHFLSTRGLLHTLPKIKFIIPRQYPLLDRHVTRLLQLSYARILIYTARGITLPRWTDKGIRDAIRDSRGNLSPSAR